MSAGVARGAVPTIRPMLENLQQLAASAFMQRATLWLNHVLSSEDAAVQRLRPHAGRFIRLQMDGWPSLLPPLPDLTFAVTPAGLVEWCGAQAPAAVDLRLTIDASNPARTLAQGLTGQRPAVEVVGDAALAADVSWLMDNLRWDIQDDLARVIGEGPAHELARIGGKLAAGLREAVATLAGLAARVAGGPQEAPAQKPDSPPR
jgi:ubiquinone biosynthesis protein UbiJ